MKKVCKCENCKYFKQFNLTFGDVIVRMCSLFKINCEKIKGCQNFKNKDERK